MGSASSRSQGTIDACFHATPHDVNSWDLQHVKTLHAKFRDDGYEFGMDMTSLQDLITSALPLPRGLTGEFWSTYVARNEEMIYPLELFAALAIQSLGLSREKAMFFFDMFDFEGRGEISYDEVAICISTVVGAFSKVSSRCCLLDEARVDKLADDVYVAAARDAGSLLSRSDFLDWVEKRLKINLSGKVTIEDAAKALGVWSDQDQEDEQTGASSGQERDSSKMSTSGGGGHHVILSEVQDGYGVGWDQIGGAGGTCDNQAVESS
ncbi:unnamed protein product [Ascophyllum nodosum]